MFRMTRAWWAGCFELACCYAPNPVYFSHVRYITLEEDTEGVSHPCQVADIAVVVEVTMLRPLSAHQKHPQN